LPTNKVLSFLQLGDVHYPDLVKTAPVVDHKDKGMSLAMVSAISSTRISEISRSIARVMSDEDDLIAIVLNGDLTTRGDMPGYEACLNFLQGALQLSNDSYWRQRKLLAVPGNHDINRSGIVAGQSLEKKFEPLVATWKKLLGGSDYLTVGAPQPTDVPGTTGSTCSVRFLPLNTCYLCGEYRAFPASIRDKVVELLTGLKKSMSSAEFERLLSEQVDCPAVSRDHVAALEKHISSNAPESISVVIGHHPLLAQPIARIDGYNELLNAGYVRESVLATRRTILYLHGHIHQDPLLLVTSPLKGAHQIIHVSAPALEDGFNLIRLYYSDITNQPLGLELTPFRFGDHLGVVKRDPIRVRLIEPDALWNEIDDPWITYVLKQLVSPQIVMRFGDLEKGLPPRLAKGLAPEQKSEGIRQALLRLEILEILEITNRDSACQLWQCHRRSV